MGSELGWLLAIKASAGGGGRAEGRRRPDEAARAFEAAKREGEAYFLDATAYVERYLDDPRHVEVQVLADAHGNVVTCERDCSIQRRHQKCRGNALARSGTPGSASGSAGSPSTPHAPSATARPGRSRGLSEEGEYFFLEMNTRIQVEHTATEMATGR